jgi:hypothetical protein
LAGAGDADPVGKICRKAQELRGEQTAPDGRGSKEREGIGFAEATRFAIL